MKPKFLIKLSLLIVISGLIIFSCRKHDAPNDQQENPLNQQFFKLPSNASVESQNISTVIKKQDAQYNFLTALIKQNGLPVWKNVITNENTFKWYTRHLFNGFE